MARKCHLLIVFLLLLPTACHRSLTPAESEALAFVEQWAFPDEELTTASAPLRQALAGRLVTHPLPASPAPTVLDRLRRAQPESLLLYDNAQLPLIEGNRWFREHYHLVATFGAGRDPIPMRLYTLIRPDKAPWQPLDLTLRTPSGDRLHLRRYRLSPRHWERAATIKLALSWEVESTPGDCIALTLALRDTDGHPLAQTIGWADQLRTDRWYGGSRVTTTFPLPLPPMPPGDYALTLEADPPLYPEDSPLTATPITLTLLTRLPDRQNHPFPPPDHPISATFGGAVRLLGYDVDSRQPTGGTMPVTLYWHVLHTMTRDAKVFVHLLGPDGYPVAQADGVPLGWSYPTTAWQPGDFLHDGYTLDLSDVPRGNYTLAVGFYDPTTGQRLPVIAEEAAVVNESLHLQPIAVR